MQQSNLIAEACCLLSLSMEQNVWALNETSDFLFNLFFFFQATKHLQWIQRGGKTKEKGAIVHSVLEAYTLKHIRWL